MHKFILSQHLRLPTHTHKLHIHTYIQALTSNQTTLYIKLHLSISNKLTTQDTTQLPTRIFILTHSLTHTPHRTTNENFGQLATKTKTFRNYILNPINMWSCCIPLLQRQYIFCIARNFKKINNRRMLFILMNPLLSNFTHWQNMNRTFNIRISLFRCFLFVDLFNRGKLGCKLRLTKLWVY